MSKKFKPVESFNANACDVTPDEDSMTCSVEVDVDGWDSPRQAYKDIEYFAEGCNDPMASDIEEELAEMGLELVYPGELVGDSSIEFKMERL